MKRALIATVLAMFVMVGTAAAARVVSEGIIIVANGSFTPNVLPRTHDAPIALSASVKISTVSGAPPPPLQTVTLEFDRHGSLQTTGLRECTSEELQSTTVAEAREICAKAIVGEGEAQAIINLSEGQSTPISLPITLFNGPTVGGDPSILAHAYLSIPVPTTYVVPIVIEPIHNGVYVYRTQVTIPQIAGGSATPISGHFTIGRRWTYMGHHYSYVSARCEVGFLQVHGQLTFANGYLLSGTLFEPCTARG
ncbi:MAG: hypothetical protein WB507_12155 [Solirubrobacterales bacterium]